MRDRISPLISGIPKDRHDDLLSYLKKQPGYKELKAKVHLHSADGGTTPMPGAISASIPTNYLQYSGTYRGYAIQVLAISEDLFIICKKLK